MGTASKDLNGIIIVYSTWVFKQRIVVHACCFSNATFCPNLIWLENCLRWTNLCSSVGWGSIILHNVVYYDFGIPSF